MFKYYWFVYRFMLYISIFVKCYKNFRKLLVYIVLCDNCLFFLVIKFVIYILYLNYSRFDSMFF